MLTLPLGQYAVSQNSNTSSAYAIAYSYNNDIHLSDAAGKSKIKITNYDGGNGYSAWSPDGKRIAFYSKYDDRKTWSIHTMNADGTERKRLTNLQYAWDNSPTWSPDGSKIAFARAYRDSSEVGHYEIWIMNADGTDQRKINGLEGGGPYFTRDGKILFHSQPGPSEICIANMDGSNLTRLTNNEAEEWHPELSPDGKQVAFMSDRDGNHEIYVMQLDGSEQKRLTFNEVDDWYPSWSPDGSQLIFSTSTGEERQIYKMNKDGSSIQPIIEGGSQAAWLKPAPHSNESQFNFPPLEGPYMGQKPPGMVAEPFAPGIISTEGWEVEGVFAPGLNEFYFTTSKEELFQPTIIGFRKENNTWKKYTEFRRTGETAFLPDGSRMLMAKGYKDRKGKGWSKRKSLGPLFDRDDWGIMRLTASSKGTYVFDDYKSGDVIRISTLKDGERQPPVKMGSFVNSGTFTAHPFIAPDESYLIWDSKREGGFGDSDLYISFRQADDSWGPAINMGEAVNTDRWEAFASVTSDGKYILFNRGVDAENHNTDIYWVDAKIIEQLRPDKDTDLPPIEDRYFGEKPPGLIPRLFTPDIVSPDGLFEGGTFSHDMKTYYFSRKNGKYKQRTFFVIRYENNKWGNESETEIKYPRFSKNGDIIYKGNQYREKTDTGWSELKSLGAPFTDKHIMGISFSDQGTSFFDEFERPDTVGAISYSRLVNGKYEPRQKMGEEINTGTWIAHPHIAPDESYLIWDVVREDGHGESDIYISFKQKDGSWLPAINMGPQINTALSESGAGVSPDGKYLFFSRGEWLVKEDGSTNWVGKPYWVDAQVIENLRPREQSN